jgi:hypothetical protein
MMRALPEIRSWQNWCCGGCGSGIAPPKKIDFEYSREEFPNGDVISRTTVKYVAPCCGGDLLLWDEAKQDCIPWAYVEAASKEGDSA